MSIWDLWTFLHFADDESYGEGDLLMLINPAGLLLEDAGMVLIGCGWGWQFGEFIVPRDRSGYLLWAGV